VTWDDKLTRRLLGTVVVMRTNADQLIDEIVAYLGDSVSVNLIGLHGSGRTRVVGGVAERLREKGFVAVLVRGVAALRDRPLAVLALAGVDIAQSGAPMVVPHAAQALSAMLPRGRSALLIDDADDLDSLSAGVVAAAHADRGFPVLFVTRPAGRHQAPNQALYDSLLPSVCLRVEPLEFSQLHGLVHELLPGPVEPSAVAQIATLSGGLPGLVRAIVDTGRRTGAIVLEQSIWRTKRDLWDDRLAQTVEPLLGALGDDETTALTSLSIAGAMPVAEARTIVPPALFTRLDDLSLLEVVDTPAGALVAVFPRLMAEYLRRTGSASLMRLDGGKQPADVSRGPGSAAGESLSSARVAVLNVHMADHWRVEVDARRRAWQAQTTPENAIPLLEALNEAAAGPTEFEAVLRGTRPGSADTGAAIQLLGWEALYRGILLRDFAAARELLVSRRQASPQFAAQLCAAEAALCQAAGIVPDDDVLAPAEPEQDPQALEALDIARRLALVYSGRTKDALQGLPATVRDLSDYPEPVRGVVVMARVFDGDLDVGARWALKAMAAAEDRLDAGRILEHAYIAGIGLIFAGRLDEGQALLDPALALIGPAMMHEYYHTGVLGLAALAANWRGRTDYFDALTAQAKAVGLRSGPFPDILRVAETDDGEASAASGRAMWAVVAERLATGHVAAAISLAVEAVEMFPVAEEARVAAGHAVSTQSPLFAAFGRYIEAVVAADPERLGECVAEFRRLGATLYSVKAGVRSALVLRSAGDLAASVRQAEAAWEQAGERRMVGVFSPLGRALGLNDREREIAHLIADGMTSQTIATTIGLSYRTVENYLSSAYRKLGSTGRADLIRAVTTWASQA